MFSSVLCCCTQEEGLIDKAFSISTRNSWEAPPFDQLISNWSFMKVIVEAIKLEAK